MVLSMQEEDADLVADGHGLENVGNCDGRALRASSWTSSHQRSLVVVLQLGLYVVLLVFGGRSRVQHPCGQHTAVSALAVLVTMDMSATAHSEEIASPRKPKVFTCWVCRQM